MSRIAASAPASSHCDRVIRTCSSTSSPPPAQELVWRDELSPRPGGARGGNPADRPRTRRRLSIRLTPSPASRRREGDGVRRIRSGAEGGPVPVCRRRPGMPLPRRSRPPPRRLPRRGRRCPRTGLGRQTRGRNTAAGRAALGAVAAGGVRHMAHRFIVGETLSASSGVLTGLWARGVASSVDLLGEATVTAAEADAYACTLRRRLCMIFIRSSAAGRHARRSSGTAPGSCRGRTSRSRSPR